MREDSMCLYGCGARGPFLPSRFERTFYNFYRNFSLSLPFHISCPFLVFLSSAPFFPSHHRSNPHLSPSSSSFPPHDDDEQFFPPFFTTNSPLVSVPHPLSREMDLSSSSLSDIKKKGKNFLKQKSSFKLILHTSLSLSLQFPSPFHSFPFSLNPHPRHPFPFLRFYCFHNFKTPERRITDEERGFFRSWEWGKRVLVADGKKGWRSKQELWTPSLRTSLSLSRQNLRFQRMEKLLLHSRRIYSISKWIGSVLFHLIPISVIGGEPRFLKFFFLFLFALYLFRTFAMKFNLIFVCVVCVDDAGDRGSDLWSTYFIPFLPIFMIKSLPSTFSLKMISFTLSSLLSERSSFSLYLYKLTRG